MVKMSTTLLKDVGSKLGPLSKTLSDILVCPLSKAPLRYCEKTNSFISDSIGVSFPIKDGIPCLVPKDGTILGEEDEPNSKDANSTVKNREKQQRDM